MFSRISSLLEEDDEPPSRVEQIIQEIKEALATLTSQIEAIATTSTANHDKLESLYKQSNILKTEAKRAYEKNETQSAQSLWEELKVVAHKIKQYQQLQLAIDQSRIKLQKQRDELEFKRDQLLAKMKVGELDAHASKNYTDIMESLMLLKHSGELAQYSEAIADSEFKTEALKELIDEPKASSVDELGQLDQFIETDKKASNQKTIDQLKAKYTGFFDSPPANETSTRKEDQLKALAAQAVAPTKADKFFDKEDTVPKSSEQVDRIKNFFGK